jgi:hypothetical protein
LLESMSWDPATYRDDKYTEDVVSTPMPEIELMPEMFLLASSTSAFDADAVPAVTPLIESKLTGDPFS